MVKIIKIEIIKKKEEKNNAKLEYQNTSFKKNIWKYLLINKNSND